MKSRVLISVVAMLTVMALLTMAGLAVVDGRAQGQSAGPQAVAEAFYEEWVSALQARDGGFDPLSYRDSAYLSKRLVQAVDETRAGFRSASQGAGGYDPLLCAQDVPAAWQVTEPVVDGGSAEATVQMLWTGNPMAYEVPVVLREVDGAWELDEVRCELATHKPLTAEQTVVQFYGIYLDVTGRANPLATRIYRDLPFLSASLVARVDALLDSFQRGAYDPFLCAQDVPTTVKTGQAVVDGAVARVPLSTSFEGHGFTVVLEQEDGAWAITHIQCRLP
ncbi:MAG: DUF3828 domain-containing protein [Anaerolineae bacterium]